MMKTNRRGRKVLSFLLTLVMVFSTLTGIVPGTVMTAKAGTDVYTNLVPTSSDSDDALAAKQVTFNDLKWYVIEDNSTSATEGTLTLFAVDSIDTSAYNTDTGNGKYSTSTIRDYLVSLTEAGGSFADVKDSIKTVNVKGGIQQYCSGDPDVEVEAKLYLLDISSAQTIFYSGAKNILKLNDNKKWWLRDTYLISSDSGYYCGYHVNEQGSPVSNTGSQVRVDTELAVRPALQLDLSKVSFDENEMKFEDVTLIVNAPASVTTVPTAIPNLVYTGSAQELITAGEANGGTMQYAIGDSSDTAPTSGWGTAIPKETETGTYHVWYKAVGDGEHADSEPGHVDVTIATFVAEVDDTQYTSFDNALAAWSNGTTLKLLADVETTSTINITDKIVTLDLNGHGIKRTNYSNGNDDFNIVISVGSNTKLTIVDSNKDEVHKFTIADKKADVAGLAVVDDVNGQESFTGGYITGGHSSGYSAGYGGGIYVNGGSLDMQAGTIIGNDAMYGGGVFVSNGTFTLNGGEIRNNYAHYGAGVNIDYNGKFIMKSGCAIKGNYCDRQQGAGVGINYANSSYEEGGTFTMDGGVITDNYSDDGAAATFTTYGVFNLNGGEITGNRSSGNLAAVYGNINLSGSPAVYGNISRSGKEKNIQVNYSYDDGGFLSGFITFTDSIGHPEGTTEPKIGLTGYIDEQYMPQCFTKNFNSKNPGKDITEYFYLDPESQSSYGMRLKNNEGYLTLPPVKYIDANGEEQNCYDFSNVTDNLLSEGLDGSVWYLVNSNVNYSSGISLDEKDFSFILGDGKKMTLDSSVSGNRYESLTIYAQSAGTGKMEVGSGISYLNKLTINGGDISINGNSYEAISGCSQLNFNGGTINITSSQADAISSYEGNINFNGGTINISAGDGYKAFGDDCDSFTIGDGMICKESDDGTNYTLVSPDSNGKYSSDKRYVKIYYATLTTDAPTVDIEKAEGNTEENPQVGDTLTAKVNPEDAGGVTYTWYRVDNSTDPATETPISGATNASYTLTGDDVGKTIKVVASQTPAGKTTITTNPYTTAEVKKVYVVEGSGTKEDPFIINTEKDLRTYAEKANLVNADGATYIKIADEFTVTDTIYINKDTIIVGDKTVTIGSHKYLGMEDGSGASLTIDGPTFVNGFDNAISGSVEGEVNIKSGTVGAVESVGPLTMTGGKVAIVMCSGKGKISGGTIGSLMVSGMHGSVPNVVITGGTFEGEANSTIMVQDGNVTIKGGKFKIEKTELDALNSYIADGYTAVEEGDYYVVKLAPPPDDAVCNITSGDTTKYYTSIETAVSDWSSSGGTLTLMKEITTTSMLEITGGTQDNPLVLDLNGHGILQHNSNNYSDYSSVIKIGNTDTAGYLLLKDSAPEVIHYIKMKAWSADSVDPDGAQESDNSNGNGVVKVSGGYIAGGRAQGYTSSDGGGGIKLWNGAVTMNGGNIVGNYTNESGGGVFINKGTSYTMNGGSITYNNSWQYGGGGVYLLGDRTGVPGSFTLTAGEISNNRCKQFGAGVCESGKFIMTGGSIKDNIAYDSSTSGNYARSGGVDVDGSVGGSFTMTGGSITGNSSNGTADSGGSGGVLVCNNGKITISGDSVIKDNTWKNIDRNVSLTSDSKIVVDSKLLLPAGTNEPQIGVTRLYYSMDTYGTFTKGYSTYNPNEPPSTYFFSDSSYLVLMDADGEATTKKYVALDDTGKPSITIYSKATGNTDGQDVPQLGDTLKVTANPSGADPVSYQWYRVDDSANPAIETVIENAINSTYTLTEEDIGKRIKGVVSQTMSASGETLTGDDIIKQTSDSTDTISKKTASTLTDYLAKNGLDINYTEETVAVKENYNYEISSTDTEYDPIESLTSIFDGNGTPTIYVRRAETDTVKAGDWVAVTLNSRPGAPTGLESTNADNNNTANGTITGAAATMEYKNKVDGGEPAEWTGAGGSTITGLKPGTYLVRTKATGSAPCGKETEVEVGSNYVPLTDAAPTITIKTKKTGNTEEGIPQIGDTLTATPDPENASPVIYEWYRGETKIDGATGADYVLTDDDEGYKIHVIAKQAEGAGGESSPEVTTTSSDDTEIVQKKSNTVQKITVEEFKESTTKTGESITIKPVKAGYEYTVVAKGSTPEDNDWKSAESGHESEGLVFDNLKPGTEYDVLVRAKGDNSTLPGDATKITVVTDVNVTITGTPVQGKEVDVTLTPAVSGVIYKWYIGDSDTPDGTGKKVVPTIGGGVLRVEAYAGDPEELIGSATTTDNVKSIETFIGESGESPVTILLDGPIKGGITIPAGKEVILDLNGQKVDGNINVPEGSKLTIKDSSSPQTGTVTGAVSADTGDIIIEGGRFDNVPTSADSGTVTIEGGMFKSKPDVGDEYGTKEVEGEYKYKVLPKSVVKSNPESKPDLKYNGNDQELITAGETDDGTMYYAVGDSDDTAPAFDGTATDNNRKWNTSLPTGKDTGTYNVWYMVVGDENHDDTTPKCIPVEISKATAPSNIKDNQKPTKKPDLQYTGEPIELVNAPADLPDGYTEVKYSPNDGVTWTSSIPKGTDTGNYTVKVKYKGDSNHEDFEGDDIIATISKADPTITNEPEKAEGITYTGSEQNLVTGGTVTGGTLQYAIGTDATTAPTSGWSDNIPSEKNAGTYYVWYRVIGDDNHNNIDPKCIPVTIAPKKITVTGITEISKTYDGTDDVSFDCPSETINGVENGDVITVTAEGKFADKNAGTNKDVAVTGYTVSGKDKDNYVVDKEHSDTTTKADIVVRNITEDDDTVTASQKEDEVLSYDGTGKAPTLNIKIDGNDIGEDNYTVTYKGVEPTVYPEDGGDSSKPPVDAGTYIAVITFKKNCTGTREVPFTVSKEEQEKPAEKITATNATGDDMENGVISGLDENKSYEYSSDNGETWTPVEPGKTSINVKPGIYKVRYAGDKNTNPSEAIKVFVGVSSKTTGVVNFNNDETLEEPVEKVVKDAESSNIEEYAASQAEAGKDVKVELEIMPKNEEKVVRDSVTKISEKVKDVFEGIDAEKIITEYLEINLEKYVDSNKVGKINDTTTPLEIELVLDKSKAGNPIVIRTHEGVAKAFERLSERPSADYKDGTYYVGDGKLYVYSQYFSDYAIVYSTEKTHYVTIDLGNGETIQKIVGDNEKIKLPTDMTKEGCAFGGWYKDKEYTNSWNEDVDTVNEDTTLYAKWNKLVTGVTVEVNNVKLTKAGETSQIKVTVAPEDADNKKVTYTSSNPAVATVDANGVITAVGNGTATITVTTEDGSKTATVNVTVEIPDNAAEALRSAEEIALNMNAGLKIDQKGSKINIKWGKVKEADGYDVYVAYCGKKFGKAVKTITNNGTASAKVTKINGKKIRLKKNFKVYVAAYKMMDGKKVVLGKTITGHVVGRNNVKYTNAKKIKLSKNAYTVKVGKTKKIKAKTVLVDKTKKQLSDAHAKEFRYATSDKKIATVSKKGKIKGIAKGTCIIYVYARNGYAKTVSVTVK